ncbi:MAG: Rrf2 family transcriptional regulator [Verrucomicrobiaceae bacterium]|nr:Rrf2 family transcriptional regulator [Verrucomicrobiaceae bacterium]
MKVSQKLEYACRAMIQLGKSCVGDQVFRVDDLADKESISSTFLVQILNDLRRAGLVQSRRGKMGGYCLAKAPSEITMDTIVRAVEGDVLGIDSDRKGESGERVADIWM